MAKDHITIEIDSVTCTAEKGAMLIEVADANDIYIPRFCYHHKLSVAANCRLCLIEVEKVGKPLPACATPVVDNMKVHTRSNMAIESQKAIMEFLLINHPLDCPICDQGGECELQDLAMGYGRDISRYQENKRVVRDKDIGPLIQTDLTRCIHCTRCVRFGEEIAGMRELGATGRGEAMTIGTYVEQTLASEISGNVIDLCPVGALTSKPFRYSTRTWELQQRRGIAAHDSVGSNVYFHILNNQIKRVTPAHNEAINEVWISDRDRFAYEGFYHHERLLQPRIKHHGTWQDTSWDIALDHVKTHLGGILEQYGGAQTGVLASNSSTTEELYLLQRLVRDLDIHNIDTRLRQIDFSDQHTTTLFPYLGKEEISDLEDVDGILLIGSYVRKEQPLINHRIKKAVAKGARVFVLNSVRDAFNYPLATQIIVSPNEISKHLLGILAALNELSKISLPEYINRAIKPPRPEHKQIAKHLLQSKNGIILLGNMAHENPEFSVLRMLSQTLAELSQTTFGYLSYGANNAGAWLAGAVPHRLPGGIALDKPGLDWHQMCRQKLKAFLLMNVEPERECWDTHSALEALKHAELVVSFSSYRSKFIDDYADILLPIAVSAETDGSYINNAGNTQHFTSATTPPGESKPAWKVLRVIADRFHLNNFDYPSLDSVSDELIKMLGAYDKDNGQIRWSSNLQMPESQELQRITEMPMNMVDGVCRRAESLQNTQDTADNAIHINALLAEKIGVDDDDNVLVTQQNNSVTLPVVIDQRVADDCVLLQATHIDHIQLGPAFGVINIRKSDQ